MSDSPSRPTGANASPGLKRIASFMPDSSSEPLTACLVKPALWTRSRLPRRDAKRRGQARTLLRPRPISSGKPTFSCQTGGPVVSFSRAHRDERVAALISTGAIDLLDNSQAAHALAPFAKLAAGCRDAAQDPLTWRPKAGWTGKLEMAPQAFEITESAPEKGARAPAFERGSAGKVGSSPRRTGPLPVRRATGVLGSWSAEVDNNPLKSLDSWKEKRLGFRCAGFDFLAPGLETHPRGPGVSAAPWLLLACPARRGAARTRGRKVS